MHEAKVAAHDRLANELAEQHQKSVDLRKQVSNLEERNQTLESAASNVKFRETNLQQEIEALRKNNEWFTTELKKRSEDHAKYRKEKSAQVAQLLRENADASEIIDSLRRTEALLRQHIDELQSKAEEDRKRIDALEDKAAQDESNFRIEVDGVRRLAALHQQTTESGKKRLQDLNAELARLQEDAAAEVGQLQAEVELERTRAAEAEVQIANLDSIIEGLKSEASDLKHSVRIPVTPRHGINGSFGTPGRAGSPAVFSPGGSHLKADATRTQLLIENNDLKKELRRVREKGEEQTGMLNDMLQELERRQPEFEELRRENDALTDQCNEVSKLLDDAVMEREASTKDARKARGDLQGLENECALLRHQVQDMTIQLRSLLWRREAEEQGLDSLPADQKQFLIDAVDNQVPDHALPSDSDTHNVITKYLVLYKTISELQHQNAEQLKTIRRLGDGYEAQEARNKLAQHEKDQEELAKLRLLVAEKEEEIKSLNIRSHTFKTERDMYSRIVSNTRSQLPAESQSNIAFAQSVPASRAPEYVLQASEIPEYSKLIKDLQIHIDLLKEESATDRTTTKSQIASLTKDNSQLQSEKVRLESQVRREQDRYTRLEGTIKMLQQEKETLQERYNTIQATLAKQDDRIVKADQEVAEVGTKLQGLESELIHLRASQEVAQSTEARLKERNQELMDERDRLSKLVSEVQSMRNEYELSTTNTRRELQAKVEKQEVDLQSTQRRLEAELVDHKKTIQQRDYERTEAQRRIDDLIAARNSAEVKSAAVDSIHQQLGQRVKELQTQLQSAEERIQSLHPSANGNQEDDAMSPEEELIAQVTDLQRRLDRKREDLEAVNAQTEGFQSIAQDAEERLQTFVEAHERLQQELSLAQEEKDTVINDLQQRVEDISSELATSTTELTKMRGQHEQESLVLNQQKEALEAEITQLRNDVTDFKEEATAQAEFVKTQADIAARAQQDYEGELAKHGKTMEKLRTLRDEHDQLKSEIAEFKAQAEAARTTLEQSQEHWRTTKSQYDTQITEAQRRQDDLKQYNQTLLKQFDEYKAQIDGLKNDRIEMNAGDASASVPGSSNLQDIETYLRREKEILEVQLNLKEQEVRRLEQQYTHTQSQLDQTREKLIAEQSRAQGSQSSTSIQDLQERVQELNVYRESNMTLRNDNSRLQTQVAEKSTALEDIQNELEPLQARISELEGELELNVGHLRAIEEDRDRWQKRHQDVLQRYDRIDPKELEDLKQQIEDLRLERDHGLEQVTDLTTKIEALEVSQEKVVIDTREATIQEVRATETDKARKGFNKVHNEKMKLKATEIEGLTNERDELQARLPSLEQELQQLREQLTNAQSEAIQTQEQVISLQQQLEQSRKELATVQQELQSAQSARDEALAQLSVNTSADADMNEEGQIEESGPHVSSDLAQKLQHAGQQLNLAQNTAYEANNQAAALQVEVSLLRDRAVGLDQEVVRCIRYGLFDAILIKPQSDKGNRILELQNELSQTRAQLSQPVTNTASVEVPRTPASSDDTEKLKEELAVALKEVEGLRKQLNNALNVSSNADTEQQPDAAQDHDQTASIKAVLDQREEELKKLEEDLNLRIDKVKKKEITIVDKANDRIRTIREKTNEELDNLKKAHQAEIEQIRQETQAASATRNDPTTQETSEKKVDASATSPPEGTINTEDLPRPTVATNQFTSWLKSNAGAKKVVVEQINKNINARTAATNDVVAKLKQEIEELKFQKPAETVAAVKEEPVPRESEDLVTELANIKAEHEKGLKDAAKKADITTKQAGLKLQLKENTIAALKVKLSVIETAAKETPTEEVAKVWAMANPSRTALKPEGRTQPPQPSTPAQPSAAVPYGQQQQGAAPMAHVHQANGTVSNTVGHVPQSPVAQQPDPFLQTGSSTTANPFVQPLNQMGRGLAQPGFTGQLQAPTTQLPQQQQQLGRGGLQAIRGAIQSNIPRGGATGIPFPGGRGRGQQGQSQPQGTNMNAHGPGASSQIGRGGARGGGRGRGQAHSVQSQQTQGSPGRGGLNPGAQHFSPGTGRGQKRGAEDDGEGSVRGGKRPRGRGGQGGGAGGAPATTGGD